MRSVKQYQIVLSDIGRVDSDNIKYLVRLLDQDTKEQVLSVEATVILSSNSFHFIGDDTEERLQRVGIDIYDLQEALEKRAYSISPKSNSVKRYLIQIPIGLLKRGDKVYDFKKKKYDTVAYIERAADNVHVAYHSIGDAPGEWKEYADNFKPQSTLWIFVDLSLEREQLIHMPAGYVQKGDMIFDPKSREVLDVDYVFPGSTDEVSIDVRTSEGVLTTIGLPHHVFLVKDLNEIPEDMNNYI